LNFGRTEKEKEQQPRFSRATGKHCSIFSVLKCRSYSERKGKKKGKIEWSVSLGPLLVFYFLSLHPTYGDGGEREKKGDTSKKVFRPAKWTFLRKFLRTCIQAQKRGKKREMNKGAASHT